jgi:hypothetical protein
MANAFDLAVALLESGEPCESLLSAWMEQLQAQGLRYCPLAAELILAECGLPEPAEEPASPVFIGDEEPPALAPEPGLPPVPEPPLGDDPIYFYPPDAPGEPIDFLESVEEPGFDEQLGIGEF